MNLRLRRRSALRTPVTFVLATLVGFAACGDDASPTDTSAPADTLADTSPADAQETAAPDASPDLASPSDVADTSAPDTTDPLTDTAGDTASPETTDTAQDTSPDDVVTPPSASATLVAWSGLDPNGPNRGAISVSTSTGSAFGPFGTWKVGTNSSPVVFGSTANLIGDVDGDGLSDLVAWSRFDPNGPDRGAINVFRSTGSSFADFETWKVGSNPSPVVFGSTANLIGDVDGDGRADLVAWSSLDPMGPYRGAINVFLSTGSAFADFATWKSGTNESAVVFGSTANLIGDVDGDGKADLVAWSSLDPMGPYRGAISVMLSTGTGFAGATTWRTGTNESAVFGGSTANLIADVNGDGKADLIAWSGLDPMGPYRGAISVYLSNGAGFDAPSTWFTGTNESAVVLGSTANRVGLSAR